MAWAARRAHLASRLVAVDARPAPSHPHPFDLWIESGDESAMKDAVAASPLTVLCVPVGAIIDLAPRVLKWSSGAVTDCGSTKAALLRSLEGHAQRRRFVAGHPMAGHPRGGIENARDDLFDDRKWILCGEGASSAELETVREFVSGLGARVVELSADEHDKSVAITSHVPQIIASALSVYAQQNAAMRAAGPGFASATRVAGGAEEMWRDIFETNGSAIGSALTEVAERLQKLGRQLEAGDCRGALDTLEQARKARDRID